MDKPIEKHKLENPFSTRCEQCKKHTHPEKDWSVWKDGVPVFSFCSAAHMVEYMREEN